MKSNKLVDYGSSSGSDSERPAPKRVKTVFYLPKKVAEEGFVSKLLPENQGILQMLPKPANSSSTMAANFDNSVNSSENSSTSFAFKPRTVAGVASGGGGGGKLAMEQYKADGIKGGISAYTCDDNNEKEDEVGDEREEDMEHFDFFSLDRSNEEPLLSSAAPKQGPAKPDYLQKSTAPQAHLDSSSGAVKKAPFVFRPIQKAAPSPLFDPDVISAKDSKLFSQSKASVQTVSHSDLLGDNESRARQRKVKESVQETRSLIDDPFSKLEGSYVASNASTRTNSIMQMAYKAKDEYFNRVERKAEQKAVKKLVRQKYGF